MREIEIKLQDFGLIHPTKISWERRRKVNPTSFGVK
jgi:hypothetical protein